jgi:hypothetical protein
LEQPTPLILERGIYTSKPIYNIGLKNLPPTCGQRVVV